MTTIHAFSDYRNGGLMMCANVVGMDDLLLTELPKWYDNGSRRRIFNLDNVPELVGLFDVIRDNTIFSRKNYWIMVDYAYRTKNGRVFSLRYDNVARYIDINEGYPVRDEIDTIKPFLTLKVINGL